MSLEIYTSPIGVPTENAAYALLDEIRSKYKDWIEIDAGIELHLDGWHAIRAHKKP